METLAIDADTSDFSPHQVVAPDEARDAMGSDATEQDASSIDAARSKFLSAEVFDSGDVPSSDNLLQICIVFLCPVQSNASQLPCICRVCVCVCVCPQPCTGSSTGRGADPCAGPTRVGGGAYNLPSYMYMNLHIYLYV